MKFLRKIRRYPLKPNHPGFVVQNVEVSTVNIADQISHQSTDLYQMRITNIVCIQTPKQFNGIKIIIIVQGMFV
jgi:hypothetical protein